MTESDSLQALLDQYDISVSQPQKLMLEAYCRRLWQLNEQINLTRHTDYEKFVTFDLIDSIEVSKFMNSKEVVLDVGSGGGVPGILLAILRDDLNVNLAESVGKKAKVLAAIVEHLELDVPVFAERAENVVQAIRCNTLVARAVGPIWKILKWFEPHWPRFDQLLLIKGPKWIDERGEARHLGYLKPLELRRIHSYPTPNRDEESVILSIKHK